MDAKEELQKLGKRIKQLSLEKGLTQSDLATAINESEEYISKLEKGAVDIDMIDLFKLAREFQIPICQLFKDQRLIL